MRQIRVRFSDELSITSNMIALVNAEIVEEAQVLDDGDHVYFKHSSKARGNVEWMKKYMKPLEGRSINETGVSDDGWPFFVLDNGNRIEVSCDPEGNGPGFLFGLPIVG